jgi:ATP-dependent RNA helicase DDX31/DBP7
MPVQIPKSNALIPTEEAVFTDVFSESSFESLGLAPGLLKSLNKLGFTNLTKVQVEIYGTISRRANAIVRSVTGSGKTLAYMVPIMQDLLSLGHRIARNEGIFVVVLSPTRELCTQIYEVCIKLCFGCVNIVPGMLVGGEDINHEKSRLRKGINVLVATPARLLYHLENTKNLTLNSLRTLVIEESDLSLSMGQGMDVRKIIDRVHDVRPDHSLQKIFTTACYDHRVRELIDDCLHGNFELIGGLNIEDAKLDLEKEEVLIPEQLSQNYVLVEENCKLSYLLCLLHGLQTSKIIVFVSTADQANFLEKILLDVRHLPARKFDENYQGKRGGGGEDRRSMLEELNKEKKIFDFPVLKLHGHIPQEERLKVYQAFCKVKTGVLLSTDVGSRGLDFPDVKLIILYDPPDSLAHYSNRVGRTARLTKVGSSLIFLHPAESLFIKVLSKRYPVNEYDPLKTFEEFEPNIPKSYPIGDSIDYLNHAIKKRVSTDNELYFMARRAFNSFCRAYSRILNKTVFHLKNLHLHNLAKSFGLKSAKSNEETEREDYIDLKVVKPHIEKAETARQREIGRNKLRAQKASTVLKNEFL